uniref:Ulp1 protease-like protein n=1 Tax=Oryza sativa subsp. japonica TaxID=39947 RepID=Q84YM2_ORYSJ|nr:Ulp1 protease-like protein [Oryza sativa Japonica Group]
MDSSTTSYSTTLTVGRSNPTGVRPPTESEPSSSRRATVSAASKSNAIPIPPRVRHRPVRGIGWLSRELDINLHQQNEHRGARSNPAWICSIIGVNSHVCTRIQSLGSTLVVCSDDVANGSIKEPKYKVLRRGTVPCTQKHIKELLFLTKHAQLPRNLRELRLGTPRADKALSDPVETKDHVKGPRALSSEKDSPTTRLGARERKFYSTLSKTSRLYGSTPRSTKASTTNVDKASSKILRLLDRSRTVGGSRQGIRNEEMIDSDKPFRCPHEADKGSLTLSLNSPRSITRDESAIFDLAGHGFDEEDYPVVDYESELQTAISTTVR